MPFLSVHCRRLASLETSLSIICPKDSLKAVDLNTLSLQSNSFIEKDGGYRFSDVIYQTRILEKPGYLFYLLEHQSTPDRWMALRMQTYLMNFLNKQVRQGAKKLPPFFLMVFYHSKRNPYPYSQDFFDLFENPAWAKEQFLQHFHLVDIQQESDEAILQHDDAATVEMLQKHIYDSDIGIAVRKLKESGCLKNCNKIWRFYSICCKIHTCKR